MSKERQRWTPEEDALLREGFRSQAEAPAGKGGTINWHEIARRLPGRSNKDCRKRYHNEVVGTLRKGTWTEGEDRRLEKYVKLYGLSWSVIAQKMGSRSADQCSKRWHHCLDPSLERCPWTDGENQRLLVAVLTHGHRWREIQKMHFPTRSANTVKNQFTILVRKKISAPMNAESCCSKAGEGSPNGEELAPILPGPDFSQPNAHIQSWPVSQSTHLDCPESLAASRSSSVFSYHQLSEAADKLRSESTSSTTSAYTPTTPGDFSMESNYFPMSPFEAPALDSGELDLYSAHFQQDFELFDGFSAPSGSCEVPDFSHSMFPSNTSEPIVPDDYQMLDNGYQNQGSTSKPQIVLQLEDVDPVTMSQVMEIVVKSKTTVKFHRS